jgi:hypothetical protein
LFPAGTDESLVAGEDNFVPLSAWTAEDLSKFVAALGTDVLYQRAAALIFHFGLDGFTLEVCRAILTSCYTVRCPRIERQHPVSTTQNTHIAMACVCFTIHLRELEIISFFMRPLMLPVPRSVSSCILHAQRFCHPASPPPLFLPFLSRRSTA